MLVVYIIVSTMHGHTDIKMSPEYLYKFAVKRQKKRKAATQNLLYCKWWRISECWNCSREGEAESSNPEPAVLQMVEDIGMLELQ